MTYIDLKTEKLLDSLCAMVQPLHEIVTSHKPFAINVPAAQISRQLVVEKLSAHLDQFATAEDVTQVQEFKRDPYRGKPYGTIYEQFLHRSKALSKQGDTDSLLEAELLLKRSLWYFLAICDASRPTTTRIIVDALIALGEVAEQLEQYDEAMDWFVCVHVFYMERDWLRLEEYCGKTSNWLIGTIVNNAARINRISRHRRDISMTVALLKAVGVATQGLKSICPSTGHSAEHFLSASYPVNWRQSSRPGTARGSRLK